MSSLHGSQYFGRICGELSLSAFRHASQWLTATIESAFGAVICRWTCLMDVAVAGTCAPSESREAYSLTKSLLRREPGGDGVALTEVRVLPLVEHRVRLRPHADERLVVGE